VLVDAFEQILLSEFLDDACSRLETIETLQFGRGVFVDLRIGSEDVDDRKLVTQADLVIVEIVCWGDLHTTRSELRIDVVIADDRNGSIGQRQSQLLADEMPIALIIRMHGDGGIAEHGLWTCRRHDQMATTIH
jgi:hypothetical protein